MNPQVKGFYDPITATVTYVVYEPLGKTCAIIDSVLDYDPSSGRTSTTSADAVIQFVRSHGLHVEWVLETHAHADHLSAAPYLKQQLGGKTAIGVNIIQVQNVFDRLFNLEPGFKRDGSQFDHLFQENDVFSIGALSARVIPVPGHTPACVAFHIGDAVFVGDTLFMPDVGTARCDFPGGDAPTLYRSIQKLLALPATTRLFVCHDYPPENRPQPAWETTVAEQRAHNIHVRDGISENEFVSMRTQRDATLEMPTLILPSVQVNIRAGEMPPPEDNGVSYLKIPINVLQ
jgi:glyoxylase-like metal-dependent hydrolase (beta-lactamase superfamily II)